MNDALTSREIARASLAFPFDVEALAPTANREAVASALDGYRQALTPLKAMPKAERDENNRQLGEIIRSIGLKVRPDFSKDQAQMWITATVEALGDQPAKIALAAARDALHYPIAFPGEVHRVILEKTEVHWITYRRAMRNLARLLDRLDRPPALTASPEAKREAERIEIADLQLIPPALRSLGLSGGWLTEEPNGSLRWATKAEQEAHAQAKADERPIARARDQAA